jgi:hypothetical protein
MRRCFRFFALASLLLLTVSGNAFAAKPLDTAKTSIVPEIGEPVFAPLATLFGTGFEAPGYAVGSLEPQNGWTSSGVNSPWQTVSVLNPNSGTQHVRIVRDGAVGAGSQRIIFSPTWLAAANTPSQTKVMLFISNDGGSDYDLIGQAPSQGFLTYRMKFSFADGAGSGPGSILILDDIGAGLEFVDTGVLWNQGVYTEAKIQFDPAAGEIRYFYGGVHIYTGIIIAATAVEQFLVFNDNFQLAGEHAGIDGLSIIDTPSDPVPAKSATWGGIKGLYR